MSIKKIKSENSLSYGGAIVLGLNDALVELSGALVGLTFAIDSSSLIATVGLITGFAAALSMAASEYLSAKEDKKSNPLRLSIYTGIAYIITVLILVSPYLAIENKYSATGVMGFLAICIIAGYTKYDSVKHKESFKRKFGEMFAISASVALISFLFGLLVRRLIP